MDFYIIHGLILCLLRFSKQGQIILMCYKYLIKKQKRSSKKDSRLLLESSFTYVNVNSINRCVDMPNQYKLTISNIMRKTPNSS